MQFEMNKFWKFGYLKWFWFLFPSWLQQHVCTCHLSVLLFSLINYWNNYWNDLLFHTYSSSFSREHHTSATFIISTGSTLLLHYNSHQRHQFIHLYLIILFYILTSSGLSLLTVYKKGIFKKFFSPVDITFWCFSLNKTFL